MTAPTPDTSPLDPEIQKSIDQYENLKDPHFVDKLTGLLSGRPDTSPGDELDEILHLLYSRALAQRDTQLQFAGEDMSALEQKDLTEAKDRLNRLMLTRERERLVELHRTDGKGLPKRDYDNVTDEAICERIEEIDNALGN